MAANTDSTDLAILRRDLRDLWEGCIPWRDAIEMIGAPDQFRKELRAFWRHLNRRAGV